jgi:hypothetical protein
MQVVPLQEDVAIEVLKDDANADLALSDVPVTAPAGGERVESPTDGVARVLGPRRRVCHAGEQSGNSKMTRGTFHWHLFGSGNDPDH